MTAFGRYELLGSIGGGEMAELLRARQLDPGAVEETVLIRRYLAQFGADKKFTKAFDAFSRWGGSLSHPNIAHVLEIGEQDGRHFIAREFVRGKDVRRLLQYVASQGTAIPIPISVHIGLGVLGALDYAHGRRGAAGASIDLMHGDVSPTNIVVSYEGAVKLTDIGVAGLRATRGGAVSSLERAAYLAPEVIRGAEADHRADIFAVGAVLYELVTGERAFPGASREAVCQAVLGGVVKPPSELNNIVSSALEQTILKALQKDPADRFQRAEEMQVPLEEVAQTAGPDFGIGQVSRWMKSTFAAAIKHEAEAERRALASAPSVTGATRKPTGQQRAIGVSGRDVREVVASLPAVEPVEEEWNDPDATRIDAASELIAEAEKGGRNPFEEATRPGGAGIDGVDPEPSVMVAPPQTVPLSAPEPSAASPAAVAQGGGARGVTYDPPDEEERSDVRRLDRVMQSRRDVERGDPPQVATSQGLQTLDRALESRTKMNQALRRVQKNFYGGGRQQQQQADPTEHRMLVPLLLVVALVVVATLVFVALRVGGDKSDGEVGDAIKRLEQPLSTESDVDEPGAAKKSGNK